MTPLSPATPDVPQAHVLTHAYDQDSLLPMSHGNRPQLRYHFFQEAVSAPLSPVQASLFTELLLSHIPYNSFCELEKIPLLGRQTFRAGQMLGEEQLGWNSAFPSQLPVKQPAKLALPPDHSHYSLNSPVTALSILCVSL